MDKNCVAVQNPATKPQGRKIIAARIAKLKGSLGTQEAKTIARVAHREYLYALRNFEASHQPTVQNPVLATNQSAAIPEPLARLVWTGEWEQTSFWTAFALLRSLAPASKRKTFAATKSIVHHLQALAAAFHWRMLARQRQLFRGLEVLALWLVGLHLRRSAETEQKIQLMLRRPASAIPVQVAVPMSANSCPIVDSK